MQQADVRIGALDNFAVHFENQPQHAVRRRMLRPEIHREVLNLSHRRHVLQVAEYRLSSRMTRGTSVRGSIETGL